MKTYKRVIALISDTHISSKYALFPNSYIDDKGVEYRANAGQKKIYGYWQNFCGVCDELKVDTVIHLGDALHGTNRKEFGRNLMFTDLEIQKDVAVMLLKQIVKRRKFFIVSGTGYHQSLDSKVHKSIAERLNGTFLGALANLRLKPSNRVMNVTHGTSGAVIYRSTILDRGGHFILQAQALGKLPKIDIIVSGHLHNFIHIHFAQQHLIQLPCWMAWEESKPYLKYYGKMQPDIGGVILMIDDKDRILVWHYLYPLPHISDMIREV